MSETMRIWVEISFNIIYLVVIWALVISMVVRRDAVAPESRRASRLVTWAFGLLALGDTGHVGFRVLAYARCGLEAQVNLFGKTVGLVGLGAVSTAFTVTIFYVLMLELWKERFRKRYGLFEWFLLAAAAFRLVLMLLPANQWSLVVPPQPWSTIRNLPLTITGLGVAFLMIRDARRVGDRTFMWIGSMILVSYACYIPVILFVQTAPLVGMLMIPKTIAYMAIGFLLYNDLYRQPAREPAALLEKSAA